MKKVFKALAVVAVIVSVASCAEDADMEPNEVINLLEPESSQVVLTNEDQETHIGQ